MSLRATKCYKNIKIQIKIKSSNRKSGVWKMSREVE